MTQSADRASRRLWCIVLAAGGSSRLGRPKQLVRLGARTLLARAVAQAQRLAAERVVVVLGADALRLRSVLARAGLDCVLVHNVGWRDGLAGSLCAGLRAVPDGARAALILLSDQPRIRDRSLRRMIRRWRGRPEHAVAAAYAGRLGVPAILPQRIWPAVLRLSGDVGARAVLNELPDVVPVSLADAAFDVDTPDDLARL